MADESALNSKLDAVIQWANALRARDAAAADVAVQAGNALAPGPAGRDPFTDVFAALAMVTTRYRSQAGRGKPSNPVHCSFCGRSSDADEVKTVVAGPTVFICDVCVGVARTSLAAGLGIESRCSFCHNVGRSAFKHGEDAICGECVEVCIDIQADHQAEARLWQ